MTTVTAPQLDLFTGAPESPMAAPETGVGTHHGGRTARARKGASMPLQALLQAGDVPDGVRVLDYGCGKGADVDALRGLTPTAAGWDPVHRPDPAPIREASWDVVTCTYVLNVIPSRGERMDVLKTIEALLAPGGTAYVSVREDRENLSGWTSRGTWQGLIDVDAEAGHRGWTLHRIKRGSFATYVYRKPEAGTAEGA